MAEVHCSRCGNDAPGLEREPLPGEIGRRVLAHACRPCWQEWLEMQVRVINEYRLSPANPQHYDFLIKQLAVFLNLPEGE